MTMLERVAAAIAQHTCPSSCLRSPTCMCRIAANAAIEAMRETTPAIEACFDQYVDEAPRWAELIDAALKDPA
jgi:hypothetical protein